jgi:hypothetical protein
MDHGSFSLADDMRRLRQTDRVRWFGRARVGLGTRTARLTEPEDYGLSDRSERAARFIFAAGFGGGDYGWEEESPSGTRRLSIWQRLGEPDVAEMKAILAEEAIDSQSVEDDYIRARAARDARDEDAEDPDSPNYAWKDAPPPLV